MKLLHPSEEGKPTKRSLERSIDNLSIDQTGAVWGAGIVHALHLANVHFETPSINTPSSALRITLNEGEGAYFGEKYKVERVFEDAGEIASGSTSVAYDVKRKKLYLHGLFMSLFASFLE